MEDDPGDDLETRMRKLFGDPIHVYTDRDAIRDGILMPFVTRDGDTGHRITRTAYETLAAHHRAAYPTYTDADFFRFFFLELQPLVGEARRRYERGGILKTTCDFRVVDRAGEVLWYVPNELGGITLMLPEDY